MYSMALIVIYAVLLAVTKKSLPWIITPVSWLRLNSLEQPDPEKLPVGHLFQARIEPAIRSAAIEHNTVFFLF